MSTHAESHLSSKALLRLHHDIIGHKYTSFKKEMYIHFPLWGKHAPEQLHIQSTTAHLKSTSAFKTFYDGFTLEY